MNVTTILASDWYQNLMQYIPDGKLFSWRSVFDGIPRIVQQITDNFDVDCIWCFFWNYASPAFCHCKNQSR